MDTHRSLPTGTVTFLFTDIEGSTRLLQHGGDRYPDVLAASQRLLRAAFQQGGGHEIDTQGDAFFVVFPRASQAISAAVAAQRSLAAHPWPEGMMVRVRMGLHTGEPALTRSGYVGLDIHRAARLAAAGHGGQILLSQTTRDLVQHDLPVGASLRDMGEHRLKDLQHPERVVQVVLADLASEFPPLKSLNAQPNNLPLQLTSFIGREREMAEVKRLLGISRLLTLTGPGGTGKTRLALQVAAELLEEYPDGVWAVELAALSDPALVPQAVATAVGVTEEANRSLTATLTEFLEAKRLLLVLDNCEHLVAACAVLTNSLLRACPSLRVLATSREPLGVPGETTWQVPALSVPDWSSESQPGEGGSHWPPLSDAQVAALSQYEAVRLFIERALLGKPDFTVTNANAAAVAQVCHRLDGIPLAIELAAARVKLLPVEQIAARLDDRFRLLRGGSRTVLPRQQTLRAAIDWSHELLSEPERMLFRRLSVFAGGWTLEAAEAVCSAEGVEEGQVFDLLSQLVDKSLVVAVDQGKEARYQMLETIRHYASEQYQQSGDASAFQRRHRDYHLAVVQRLGLEHENMRADYHRQLVERLSPEHENMRVALTYSTTTGEAEAALRLVSGLAWLWGARGHWTEGRQRLAEVLSLPGGDGCRPARAVALTAAGALAGSQGDYEAARAFHRESQAIWQALGDQRGVADSLLWLGRTAHNQGDYVAARSAFEGALAIWREIDHPGGMTDTLGHLGMVAMGEANPAVARTFYEEALAIGRQQEDQQLVAAYLRALAHVAEMEQEIAAARTFLEESLAISRELGAPLSLAESLRDLGSLLARHGDYPTGRALVEESLAICRGTGDRSMVRTSLGYLAGAAWAAGDLVAARGLYEEVLGLDREASALPMIAWSLRRLGEILYDQQNDAEARLRLEESLAISRKIGDERLTAAVLHNLGMVAERQGAVNTVGALNVESLRIWRQRGDRRGIWLCLEPLAAVANTNGRPRRAARLFGAASELRESITIPDWPAGRANAYEDQIATLRATLGEVDYDSEWETGRALTWQEAAVYALQEEADPS